MVWVLYEEKGFYEDYGVSILGVFSTRELAMSYFDMWLEKAILDYDTPVFTVWSEWDNAMGWWGRIEVGDQDHTVTVESFEIDSKGEW